MFYRFRQSYGETRPLSEAEGHLFHRGEGDDLLSFLAFVLFFSWDGFVLPYPKNLACAFSHDQWGEIAAETADTLAEVKTGLVSYRVQLDPR
jgi:hypothetical protein